MQRAPAHSALAAAIVGLGKLGGRELTTGSDLDVFVIFEADGETDGAERVDAHTFYSAAAERLAGETGPKRTLAFVSGSQGEPFSALSRVSEGEHRDLAVGPGDTVVLSARAIPGNERTVSRLIEMRSESYLAARSERLAAPEPAAAAD